MTAEQEKQLKKVISKVVENNIDIVDRYKNGQRGLIGFIMKKVIKESTMGFYSKESKQKLVLFLKNELN